MVQCFGRKRHAVAVAVCKEGKGLIRLNGQPLHLVEPSILRIKVMEPCLILGRERFAGVDIRLRVRGGGHSSQIYAIRQALAKAIVAYFQKCASARRQAALRAGSARRLRASESAARCRRRHDAAAVGRLGPWRRRCNPRPRRLSTSCSSPLILSLSPHRALQSWMRRARRR